MKLIAWAALIIWGIMFSLRSTRKWMVRCDEEKLHALLIPTSGLAGLFLYIGLLHAPLASGSDSWAIISPELLVVTVVFPVAAAGAFFSLHTLAVWLRKGGGTAKQTERWGPSRLISALLSAGCSILFVVIVNSRR